MLRTPPSRLSPSIEILDAHLKASSWLSAYSIQPVICPSLWTGTCPLPKVVWQILLQVLGRILILTGDVPVRMSSLHAPASSESSTGLCGRNRSLPSAELHRPNLLAPVPFNLLASLRWPDLVCMSPSCVSRVALPSFYLYQHGDISVQHLPQMSSPGCLFCILWLVLPLKPHPCRTRFIHHSSAFQLQCTSPQQCVFIKSCLLRSDSFLLNASPWRESLHHPFDISGSAEEGEAGMSLTPEDKCDS